MNWNIAKRTPTVNEPMLLYMMYACDEIRHQFFYFARESISIWSCYLLKKFVSVKQDNMWSFFIHAVLHGMKFV